MYKCEVCDKSFDQARKLNGHKRTHCLSKAHAFYLQNPKLCIECSSPIGWKTILQQELYSKIL